MNYKVARPENYLIEIVGDPRVVKRSSQFPGLFEVHFSLNMTPDRKWIELFRQPTSLILNLHIPDVQGNLIVWMASEESIRGEDKRWIYDWVKSANERFLPIVQQRMQEEERKKEQKEGEEAKIDELNRMLRRETAAVIRRTNAVLSDVCSLKLAGCTSKDLPSPVMQIIIGSMHQNVCQRCLEKQLKSGTWREG